MTSKFLELGTLAEQSSEAFHKRHERAQFIARAFVRSYIAYLEAPSDSVKFIRLDGMLELTDDTSEVFNKVPLVFASGGWWHFAFSIKYARVSGGSFVTERNKMSIRIQDENKFTLIQEDRQFAIDSTMEDRYAAINAYLYESSKSAMGKHFGEPTSRIGFVNTDD